MSDRAATRDTGRDEGEVYGGRGDYGDIFLERSYFEV